MYTEGQPTTKKDININNININNININNINISINNINIKYRAMLGSGS